MAGVMETEEQARSRFQSELEFVQCLANPNYLNFLAQRGYLREKPFVNYLKYLLYWKEPEYAKFLKFHQIPVNTNSQSVLDIQLKCDRNLVYEKFISQLMIFSISFVSTVFCGHLGKTELAGVSLAIAVINVTGLSVGVGLASACDTLISQTFGSKNLKRVGVILQRGVLILILACFPCWAVLINTESILLAVKQNARVASLSQLYVKIYMPALPAVFMYQLQSKYLQNQGIIWPQVITGAAGNILNALINYLFLHVLNLGVAGSAIANSISQCSLAVILFIYIWWRGLHKATWDGWTRDCLQEWGAFFHLAVPSMLMLCVEWWTYEIGGFLAGLISEAELGAQSVVYGVATIAYMAITGGIVRGAGKQLLGAGCILAGYYLVGFPIGVSLMFALNMGIIGLWSGFFVCVSLQSLFFLILIYKLDWKRATEQARKRAGVQTTEPKVESYGLENKCADK
ncbi:Multidrug and toxin extrusion protein 1, partial [Clarias magur]